MGRRSGRAFTKRWIDTLKAGSEKGDWYSDRDHPGFLLRVYADGSKAFAVRYTVRGTTTRRIKSLGRLGNVTLEQARAAALEVLSSAALGGDPLAEKPALPTWGAWSKTYFERLTTKTKETFHRRFLGLTDEANAKTGEPTDSTFRDIRARWNARPLDTFRAEDVEAERAAIRTAKGEPSANRWLAVVAACFQAAVRAEILTRNPAANVKAGRENPPRDRVLSPDEVARLLSVLPSDPDQHAVAAVLLALLGGARRGEALGLRWSDVNLDEGRATLPDSKSGKRRFLPLVPHLVDFLRELPRDGAFVVAGRGLEEEDDEGKKKDERPRPDIKRAWDRITTAAGLEGVTFHDLRRTFGLGMSRAAGLRVAQEALGHSTPDQTAAVYTPESFDAVKAAAEKVAAVYPFPARRTA
jgi:integrase